VITRNIHGLFLITHLVWQPEQKSMGRLGI